MKKHTYRLTTSYMSAYGIPKSNAVYLKTDNRANSKAWIEEVKAIEAEHGKHFEYFVNVVTEYVGEIKKH